MKITPGAPLRKMQGDVDHTRRSKLRCKNRALRLFDAVSSSIFGHLTLFDAMHLGATCQRLRKLRFSGIFPSNDHIDLARCTTPKEKRRISNTFVQNILVTRRDVTAINIQGCRNLRAKTFKAIAMNCPALTSLNCADIEGLTDDAILAIAANCPSLRTLDVGGCWKLMDASIKAIAAKCSLTSLTASHCKNLTTASIKAIAAHCPSLTRLNVWGC